MAGPGPSARAPDHAGEAVVIGWLRRLVVRPEPPSAPRAVTEAAETVQRLRRHRREVEAQIEAIRQERADPANVLLSARGEGWRGP